MTEMRWRGQNHETLHQWINSGDGARAAVPQLEYWEGLKKSLADISNRLNDSLNSIGATWEGAAGESAHRGMTPLREWADAAQSAADAMRQSAQDQADHVSTARAAMPEPVPQTTGAPAAWAVEGAKQTQQGGNPGPAAAIARQAADHEHQERAAASASERAVQVMNNYQGASEHNAATLGQFSAPPNIVVEVGDTVVTGAPAAMHGPGAQAPAGMAPQGTGPQGGPPQHAGAAPTQAPSAAGGLGPVAGTAAAGAAAARFAPRPQRGAPGGAPTQGASAPEYSAGEGAATLGAGAGIGAVGARAAEPMAPGGFTGARGGGDRSRETERPAGRTGAAANQAGNPTAASSAAPGQQPGAHGPAGAPVAPGMGGAGMGGGDTTRGPNPYLANRGLTGAPPDEQGFDPLGKPADGGHTGAVGPSGQQHGPGNAGPQPAPGPQSGHAGSYAAPEMGPGAAQPVGPGAVPPAAGGGAGMGGGYEESYERSSYLVDADNVFDDEQVRVAPPVIGEDLE